MAFDDRVELPTSTVYIGGECSGADAMCILAAAVLAYPAGWRRRLAGVAIGAAVTTAVNAVRVVSHCWVAFRSQPTAEWLHLYVWPPLLILAAVLTFVLWVELLATARPRRRPAADSGEARQG